MATWNEILKEVNSHVSPLDAIRRKYLSDLSELTGRNTVAYYSGWLQPKTSGGYAISDDDKNGFMACFYDIDRSRGLDLILHSPGGSVAATESLIDYLREMFSDDIRTFVPQISMSGGTMLACAGNEVVMGKHSNLGPIDPQFGGIPARELLKEFAKARDDVANDAKLAHVWGHIIAQYPPTLLEQASHALKWSEEIAKNTLMTGMFFGDDNAEEKSRNLAHFLLSDDHHAHDRHIDRKHLRRYGMKVTDLESDQDLQNKVLSVHHSFMITFGSSPALKIVENQNGIALIRNAPHPVPGVRQESAAPPPTQEQELPGLWKRIKRAIRYVFSPPS